MINQNFVYFALLLTLIGSVTYIRDTLYGKTKPNRITWFLWSVVPLIAYFAQRDGGGGLQILYTLTIAVLAAVIFGASFVNKNAYWAVSRFDLVCGLVAITAAVLLLTTANSGLVLGLSIVADLFAALPTLIKSFSFPDTETSSTYLLEVFSSVIILLTLRDWRFANYAFALYILAINSVFGFLLLRPRRS